MAQYHVGCGLTAIYAGTINKKGDTWINKSAVTNEAINAVIQHMYFAMPEEENEFAYAVKMNNGKFARLKLEVTDKCPEWAKEQLGETE